MSTFPLVKGAAALFLSLCTLLPSSLQAAAMTAAEQVQVLASRATSSLMIIRGEGFQDIHLERLAQDIVELNKAAQNAAAADAELPALVGKLVTQLRNGVSFGPNEDDMPWDYTRDLAQALRDVLTPARAVAGADPSGELPAQIEYLGVQYLARAYMGSFEIAREQTDNYIGQDERQLVPRIDEQLAGLSTSNNPAVNKLKTRWNYLRAALMDMNSGSSALISSSGRPFAPMAVDRHTRSLIDQWVSLDQVAAN